jgi:hypothetical protein
MKNFCYTSIFQDCSDFRRAAAVYPAGLEDNSKIFTRINTRKTARGPGNPEMPRREQKKHAFHGAKKACFFCGGKISKTA